MQKKKKKKTEKIDNDEWGPAWALLSHSDRHSNVMSCPAKMNAQITHAFFPLCFSPFAIQVTEVHPPKTRLEASARTRRTFSSSSIRTATCSRDRISSRAPDRIGRFISPSHSSSHSRAISHPCRYRSSSIPHSNCKPKGQTLSNLPTHHRCSINSCSISSLPSRIISTAVRAV